MILRWGVARHPSSIALIETTASLSRLFLQPLYPPAPNLPLATRPVSHTPGARHPKLATKPPLRPQLQALTPQDSFHA
ncbi:hypothetical protein PPTS312_19010 [Pseudomonas putida]|uniref:Uncharacterized protein n=1 Tax=Pseudomonas putida TaxID=303 RepID=A0A7U6RCN9_PSEPU|nr:hypothetical protein PPTS312_19010 [Pseudomonas putida]